jgi:uncharacterized protein with HEPN domain
MPGERRDAAHLWDMLQSAKSVVNFVRGVTLDQYRSNLMVRRAVEREVEIIGEAARRVSDSFKAAHPEIPWCGIIAQRNVLSHEYDEIDDTRIWRVAVEHVPRLVDQLTPLIPPEQGEA